MRRLSDVNKLLPGKVILPGEIIYELALNILQALLFLPSSSQKAPQDISTFMHLKLESIFLKKNNPQPQNWALD